MKNGGKRVMFNTIHHIAIIGSDYEKSKHFYVDLLGFKVIRENYRKERDDYKIDLACGPQEIELFIIKNAPARVNYPEALGLLCARDRGRAQWLRSDLHSDSVPAQSYGRSGTPRACVPGERMRHDSKRLSVSESI